MVTLLCPSPDRLLFQIAADAIHSEENDCFFVGMTRPVSSTDRPGSRIGSEYLCQRRHKEA